MDIDPPAPENVRMVNWTFICPSGPDIRKKLQKDEGASGMNPPQLVDIAFKVYCNRESKKTQMASVFLGQTGNQRPGEPKEQGKKEAAP